MEQGQSTLEGLEVTPEFWNGKRVLLTGHTGFKGSWMALWLQQLGARLVGYALPAPSEPSMFEVCRVGDAMLSLERDIRDLDRLKGAFAEHQPEIVIHMAAQSLVRQSFRDPVETYATNVMGTVHLLEAVRSTPSVEAVVVVSSDKCYENHDRPWNYSENEAMGGYDPYSSSKGCTELVTAAYRRSFFENGNHPAAIASARAGNVIGGGDWAADRLVPDMIRAMQAGRPVQIRNPDAIRPWQHVLEPVHGYLHLAEQLCQSGSALSGGWNFGPDEEAAKPVSLVADQVINLWGNGSSWELDSDHHPHEAPYLGLDCSKAKQQLDWQTLMPLSQALECTIAWYKAHLHDDDMHEFSLAQIAEYQKLATT